MAPASGAPANIVRENSMSVVAYLGFHPPLDSVRSAWNDGASGV